MLKLVLNMAGSLINAATYNCAHSSEGYRAILRLFVCLLVCFVVFFVIVVYLFDSCLSPRTKA